MRYVDCDNLKRHEIFLSLYTEKKLLLKEIFQMNHSSSCCFMLFVKFTEFCLAKLNDIPKFVRRVSICGKKLPR